MPTKTKKKPAKKATKMLLWKVMELSVGDKMMSVAGKRHYWTLGKKYSINPKRLIRCCYDGYHASPTIREAYCHIPGRPVIALVEASGDSDRHVSTDGTKYAHRHMKVLKAWIVNDYSARAELYKITGADLKAAAQVDKIDGIIRFGAKKTKKKK